MENKKEMSLFHKGVNGDSLSLATYYLRLVPAGGSDILATGTGFIYQYSDEHFLITNGQNLTRINPDNGERITSSMAFPALIDTKIRFWVQGEEAIATHPVSIPLYRDEEQGETNWFVHPVHGYKVDVVAMPFWQLSDIPKGNLVRPINTFDFVDDLYLAPADEVFIIGYPLNITGGKELLIWKRGSIASEPGVDLDNLPRFLVDTATRAGMSGSPVIFRRSGIHHANEQGLTPDTIIGTEGFVGVYSGRIGAEDNFRAQLGIVWKKTVIEEILQARVWGDIAFQKI